MFPSKEESELVNVLNSTESLEDAIAILLESGPSIHDAYAFLLGEDLSTDDDRNNNYSRNADLSDEWELIAEKTTFASDSNLQEKLTQQRKDELEENGEFLRLKVRRQSVWADTQFKWNRISEAELKKNNKGTVHRKASCGPRWPFS